MSDHLKRLLELIDGVLDLPKGERLAWLEKNCDDVELRSRVLNRVVAAELGVGGLQSPAAEKAADLVASASDDQEDLVGRRFGPFRIERHIGSGGMGVVYLTRRDDEHFEQLVVIKRVRRAAGLGQGPSDAARDAIVEACSAAELSTPVDDFQE
jgi:hypothetical protein